MTSRLRETWGTPTGRGFIMLAVMTAAYGFAVNAQNGIVTNFFQEILLLDGPQFGYITAVREVGGFTLIFLMAVLYRISMQHVTAGAMVLLAIGFALFGFSTSFGSVVPWVVITSFALHEVMQMQYSLGMSLTTEAHSGGILGKMASIQQMGTFAALTMVFVVFHFGLFSYRATFIVLAVVSLVGAVAVFRFPHLHEGKERRVPPRREPFVWKRAYRYYYVLNVLDGARQQVFFSFGLWVLVNRFGLSVSQVSVLLLTVAFGSIMSSSWIGRTIDSQGEKRTLSVVNMTYVVALAGFAVSGHALVACFFYVLYAFIWPFSSIAATTYLRKIAVPQDVAPSLAMGVTLTHATAVVVPVVAGFILNFVGYQIPFFIACVFAVVAIGVTRGLNPERQRSDERKALDDAARPDAAASWAGIDVSSRSLVVDPQAARRNVLRTSVAVDAIGPTVGKDLGPVTDEHLRGDRAGDLSDQDPAPPSHRGKPHMLGGPR